MDKEKTVSFSINRHFENVGVKGNTGPSDPGEARRNDMQMKHDDPRDSDRGSTLPLKHSLRVAREFCAMIFTTPTDLFFLECDGVYLNRSAA